MGRESSDVLRFDLMPLLQGQTRIDNLKVLITRLILFLEVCNVKTTYRKSFCWEYFDLDRFDLGPLLQYKKNGSLTLVSCISGGYKFDPCFKVKRG